MQDQGVRVCQWTWAPGTPVFGAGVVDAVVALGRLAAGEVDEVGVAGKTVAGDFDAVFGAGEDGGRVRPRSGSTWLGWQWRTRPALDLEQGCWVSRRTLAWVRSAAAR